MYRLLRCIIQLFSEALKDEKEQQQQNPGSGTHHEWTAKQPNDLPSKYYEKEEQTITGKVTHLYGSYGLVNGYIYFDNNSLKTNDRPQVDDAVDVTAVRQARHTGWVAVSVCTVTDDWDDIRDVHHTSGTVTNITADRSGTVDYKYKFSPNSCKGYEPWRGDKVFLTLVSNGTTEVVEKIQPFASQNFTGKVVHAGQRFCFIDGDIAFTRECCINSYAPCKGDVVSGQMIECDQGQRWLLRALTVCSSDYHVDRLTAAVSSAQGDSTATKQINGDYIFIEGDFQFKKVAVGCSETRTIFLRNGTKDAVRLNALSLEDSIGSQFTVSSARVLLEGQHAVSITESTSLSLLPGMTAYFTLTFHPRYVGEDCHDLLFNFSGLTLTRTISGICVPSESGSSTCSESDVSARVYRQVKHNILPTDADRSVMPGVRPQFRQKMSERMKLTYFDGRGSAELTRLLFKLAEADFIDNRVTGKEWKEFKPTTPKGQLPVLEVDGKMICESQSIARFVAREYGLYGSSNWEGAVVDMIFDSVATVFVLTTTHRNNARTDKAKAEALKKVIDSLESLEKLVVQLRKGDFVLGDKASLADAALYSILEFCETAITYFKCDFCPTVTEIASIFSEIPSIADWLKSRPETTM